MNWIKFNKGIKIPCNTPVLIKLKRNGRVLMGTILPKTTNVFTALDFDSTPYMEYEYTHYCLISEPEEILVTTDYTQEELFNNLKYMTRPLMDTIQNDFKRGLSDGTFTKDSLLEIMDDVSRNYDELLKNLKYLIPNILNLITDTMNSDD